MVASIIYDFETQKRNVQYKDTNYRSNNFYNTCIFQLVSTSSLCCVFHLKITPLPDIRGYNVYYFRG